MICLELLLEKLCIPGLEIINPTGRSYSLIIRNDSAVDLHSEEVINVITAEELAISHASGLSGSLFIVGTSPDASCIAVNHDIVLFGSFISADDLISRVRKILYEYQRFLEYKIKLETLAGTEASLYDFFLLFSSYFNNPVVFGDSGGNILFMENLRKDFYDYDETINYWITHGYVPYEFSRDNGNIEMTALWQKSPVPVLLNEKFAKRYARLSYRTCPLLQTYNNYFSIVQVYEKYRCFDKDVLALTGDTVSLYYTNHAFIEVELPRSKFFRSIVQMDSPPTPPSPSLESRARQFNLLDSDAKSIVVLDFSEGAQKTPSGQAKSTEKWNYVKTLLSRMQPPILYFEGDSQIILLLKTRSHEGLAKLEKNLRSTLQPYIIMACSCVFENIFESCQMYRKALLALDTGKALYPDSNIYYFKELFFEAFLYLLHTDSQLSLFILGGLEDLINYDAHKNTEFASTLYEYLMCNKNIAELSKKMHIHRNTTLYRLEKASELLNIDLDDYESTARLFISFKALDFLKKIERGCCTRD